MNLDRKTAGAGRSAFSIYSEEEMAGGLNLKLLAAADENGHSIRLQPCDQGSGFATGRPVPSAAPPTPAGSQLLAPDEALVVTAKSSPACRSTPVSVQGGAVEMLKE
jgi:hypothetical protein